MAVFASDIYTAVILLAYDRWSSEINPAVPINISRWIFAGCIILSTVLIIFEFMIAIRVSREKNISRTYTNQIARKLYSIKGYNYFCLFGKITKSRNKKEYLALFVYFSLKGWVRLIFADGPRQVINALTLYSVLKVQEEFLDTLRDIATHSHVQALVISVMLFSLVVWLFNIFQFIFALLCAIPLYVHVEKTCSGLEEYCYVRINKRIAELVKRYYERDLMELRKENKRKSKQPTLPTFLKQKDSNATLVSYTSIDSKTNLLKESNSNTNLSSISSVSTVNTNTKKKLDPMYDPFTNNRQYRTNIDVDQPERKVPKRFPANPVQRKAVGGVTNNYNDSNNNNNYHEHVPFRPTTAPPGRNLTGVSSVSQQNSKPVYSNRQNIFDQTAPSYSVRNLPKESDYGPRSKTAPPTRQQAESVPHQKSTPIEYVQPETAYSVHNLPKPNDYAPRSKTAPLQGQPVEPLSQPVNKTTRPQEYDQVEHSYSVNNLPKPRDYPMRSQTAPLPKQQIVTLHSNSGNASKLESVINAQLSAHLLSGTGQQVSKQHEQQHFLNSEPISTMVSQSFNQPKPDIAFSHQEIGVSTLYSNTAQTTFASSSPLTTQESFSTANNYYSDDSFKMSMRSNTKPILQQGINQPDFSFDPSKSLSVHPPNFKDIDNTKNDNSVNSFGIVQHNLGMQEPTNITVNGRFDPSSNPVETLVSSQPSHDNGSTYIMSKRPITVPPESQSKFSDFSNNSNINSQLDSSNMITQFAVAPPLPLSREDFSSPSPNSNNNNLFIQSNLTSNKSSNSYANIAAPPDQVHYNISNNDSTSALLASQNHYHVHAGYIFDLYYPSEIASALDYNTDLSLIQDTAMDDVDNQKTDEKLSKTPYPDDFDDKLEILFPSRINTVENNPVIPYSGYENNDFKEFDKNIKSVLPYPAQDLVEELITSNRYSSYVLEHENGVYNAETTINSLSHHKDAKK